MSMCRISIVIPVYNKAEYIAKCLESCLAQQFPSFEVVAVDDGSRDDGGRICDEMAARDSRLRVIHTENGGVTAARRKGVEVARGEYVTFVDADDSLRPGALECMYKAITETGADEVVATFHNQYGKNIKPTVTGVQDPNAMLVELMGNRAIFCVLWAVLFRKELLDGCLSAPREIRSGEDVLMQIMVLMKQPKVVFIEDSVYNYVTGLPNDRTLNLDEQRAYDDVLRQVFAPRWRELQPLFTLRQAKMYENFLFERQFNVYKEYYKEQFRGKLTMDIPKADRTVCMLPPCIAYWPVYLKKRFLSLKF